MLAGRSWRHNEKKYYCLNQVLCLLEPPYCCKMMNVRRHNERALELYRLNDAILPLKFFATCPKLTFTCSTCAKAYWNYSNFRRNFSHSYSSLLRCLRRHVRRL